MKKRVIIAVAAVLVLAVIVFTGKKDKTEEPTTTVATTTEQEITEDDTPEIQNGTKNPDKLVKITMPLSFYSAAKQGDTDGFINEGNYEKIKVDEKSGTFTVTMKSLTHDFMLSNVGLQVIKSLASLLDNERYPYIKQLGKYNSDFSQIELIVDAEEYKSAEYSNEIAPFVASCGIFYQMYSTENKYQCTVTIRSEKDNSVVDEYTAKQNNGNMG